MSESDVFSSVFSPFVEVPVSDADSSSSSVIVFSPSIGMSVSEPDERATETSSLFFIFSCFPVSSFDCAFFLSEPSFFISATASPIFTVGSAGSGSEEFRIFHDRIPAAATKTTPKSPAASHLSFLFPVFASSGSHKGSFIPDSSGS